MHASLGLLALLLLCGAARAEDGGVPARGAGLVLRDSASDEDTGIPAYPGAVVQPRTQNQSPALDLAFWASGRGMHLSLVKYWSRDSAVRVAAFYRQALAQYGSVIDCSASPRDAACEDEPEEGTVELRAGPKSDRRIVASVQKKDRCEIAAVRVRAR